MNVTEAQFRELQQNISGARSAGERARKETTKPLKKSVYEGPLDITLILYGHCPSKKSNYRTAAGGRLISTPETKEQMESLTAQAMVHWGSSVTRGLPVDSPEVTTTFYVRSGRSDEDGKYVTLMDILQKAGVMVNDNISHWNGRKVHEPCIIVPDGDEKVEIRVVKYA